MLFFLSWHSRQWVMYLVTVAIGVVIQKWFNTLFAVICVAKCPSWGDLWNLQYRGSITIDSNSFPSLWSFIDFVFNCLCLVLLGWVTDVGAPKVENKEARTSFEWMMISRHLLAFDHWSPRRIRHSRENAPLTPRLANSDWSWTCQFWLVNRTCQLWLVNWYS